MIDTIEPIRWKNIFQKAGYVMIVAGILVTFFSKVNISDKVNIPSFSSEEKTKAVQHIMPKVTATSQLDTSKIRRIQLFLVEAGDPFASGVSVSGSYDKKTREGIKKFQKEVDIPDTGIVDAATFSKLEEYIGLRNKEENIEEYMYGIWDYLAYSKTHKNENYINEWIIIQEKGKSFVTILSKKNEKSISASLYGSINKEGKVTLLSTSQENSDWVCLYKGNFKENSIEGTYHCPALKLAGSANLGEWSIVKRQGSSPSSSEPSNGR